MTKVDFIIVGQGLAGSLLAWRLHRAGQRIILLDNHQENASQIAAGLINPITGMRMVLQQDIGTLFNQAMHCYQDLALFFNQPLFHSKPMLRSIRSKQEQQLCQQKFNDPNYRPYLNGFINKDQHIFKNSFGYLQQLKTGYLDTKRLLNCLSQYFREQQILLKTEFNYNDLQLQPILRWHEIEARQLIFCEGHRASKNPWFSWLPFQLVKGEIIDLMMPKKLPNAILNYGHWLLPVTDSHFRTGATFDRHDFTPTISLKAKKQLIDSLQRQVHNSNGNQIIQQASGIRPATLDKLPFLGTHPKHKKIHIFNGFGAKGSLQIPWYSQLLQNYLLNKRVLPSQINISRHYPLYEKTNF